MSLQLPCVLDGRYEVRRRIGSGGMGEVYVARHLGLDREVAVKLLATTAADPSMEERVRERFRREAVALSRLRHPNTVQVIDFGWTDQQRPYIITELLTGEGLERLMAQGPLPVERALHVLLQICRSLAEAHQHGIVHRDLKPSNVIVMQAVGTDDFVKVIDFGVARLDAGDAQARVRPLTVEGTTLGTPEYMAPEQARGDRPSPATDVYALGCMLYEMVTGRPPFAGDSALQVMIKQIREEPLPFAKALPGHDLPPAVEELVQWCMRKAPAERPQDAGVLVTEIRRLQAAVQAAPAARAPERGAPERVSRLREPLPQDDGDSGYRRPMALRRSRRRGGRATDPFVPDDLDLAGPADEPEPAPEASPAPAPPEAAPAVAAEVAEAPRPHTPTFDPEVTVLDARPAFHALDDPPRASETPTRPEPARPRVQRHTPHAPQGHVHTDQTVVAMPPLTAPAGPSAVPAAPAPSPRRLRWALAGVLAMVGVAVAVWVAW